MKKNTFVFILSLCMVLAFSIGVFSKPAEGQGAFLAYGGTVVYADYYTCDCSGMLYILYEPFSPYGAGPGELLYSSYSTILYSYYNVWGIGAKHAGQYIPGVAGCWQIEGYYCIDIYADGLIYQVGTSGV
jgi:hypothetical protein